MPIKSERTQGRRSPVVASSAQVANKDDDRIVHPMDLIEDAARLALDAAGIKPESVQGIFTTPLSSLSDLDAADLLGTRIMADTGPRVVSGFSAAAPQSLLAEACVAVARGDIDVAVVAGGVGDASIRRANRQGLDPPTNPTSVWSQGSDRPPILPYTRWRGAHVAEIAAGAGLPVAYFALIQSVLHQNMAPTEQAMRLGTLLAPFTHVAARRPHLAWFPRARQPDEIWRASHDNRNVAEPYTKLMCSFPTVDMAAALVITPTRSSGPAVRPLAIATAQETGPPSTWQHMDTPMALGRAVEESLLLADLTTDDIDAFDLYSCFPAAILLARNALGLDPSDPRPLTASGGHPYFGGPGASYSIHGLSCLFEDMLAGRVGRGMAVSIGGIATKYSVGVYGLDDAPFRSAQPITSDAPAWPVSDVGHGRAVVEAMTVLHDPLTGPVNAPIVARLATGERIGARSASATIAAELSGTCIIGEEVELETTAEGVLYRPDSEG